MHARTVVPAVGVDLSTADRLEQRRQHVVALTINGLRGLYAGAAGAPDLNRIPS